MTTSLWSLQKKKVEKKYIVGKESFATAESGASGIRGNDAPNLATSVKKVSKSKLSKLLKGGLDVTGQAESEGVGTATAVEPSSSTATGVSVSVL